MSALGKIREKSGLLMIIIGGALAAFVLGDLFSSGNFFFDNTVKHIAEIGNSAISPAEFDRRLKQAEENYMMNTQQNNLDESTREMIFNETWNQMVKEIIMDKEYENLGLKVTPEELYDMVRGKNPHPTVRQGFTNPNTGVFDPNAVLNFLKTMDDDQTGDAKSRWISFEKGLKKERYQEKYNNLVKKGMYVPSFLAKNDHFSKTKNISFDFVLKRYADLADDQVSYTDSDLKKYLNNNLKKFEQEAYRKLEYVSFVVEPSKDDMEDIKDNVNRLFTEFQQAEDDSLFVLLNSSKRFDSRFFTKDALNKKEQEELFDAEPGTFLAPYVDGFEYKFSKLRAVKFSPDSVKARHILLPLNDNDTLTAKTKADSLMNVIKRKRNFEAMAKDFSEDVGSAAEGGDLGWFAEGVMVKPFETAAFGAKKGQLVTAISQFGLHIIEVTDKSSESKKVQLSTVILPIEPSSTTYQKIYADAGAFATKNNTIESLTKAVDEAGLTFRTAEKVLENDKNIAGLSSSRDIVKWAFKAKLGDVSMPFELEDRFVVVALKEARDKGVPTVDQVRGELEVAVIKEKKAEKIAQDIKAANASSLQDLATKLNTEVKKASNINFNSFSIPGAGREPKVIGKALTLPKETLSNPIEGELGVYVVYVTQEAQEVAEPGNLAQIKQQLRSTTTGRVDFEVFEALKKQADIVDNRAVFY